MVSAVPLKPAPNQPNNKPVGDPDPKKRIQLLHQKLENGEDFGALATTYSEDANTASSGGEMGMVPESQLHEFASPDIYDAITKLKPGQFSEVLPVYGGPVAKRNPIVYAIYKLIGKEAAGQRTLDNPRIQAFIRQSLRDTHAQLLKAAYLEKLRDDAKVHNYLADQILNEGVK